MKLLQRIENKVKCCHKGTDDETLTMETLNTFLKQITVNMIINMTN